VDVGAWDSFSLHNHKLENESATANPMWLRHVFTILDDKLRGMNITQLLTFDPKIDSKTKASNNLTKTIITLTNFINIFT